MKVFPAFLSRAGPSRRRASPEHILGVLVNHSTVTRLHEVIAALDRRTPRPGHPAEAAIARDAADLRIQALARLAQLERRPIAKASR